MLLIYVAFALLASVVFIKYSRWRLKFPVPGKKHSFYNILGDLLEFDLKKKLNLQLIDIVPRIFGACPQEQLVCMWFSFIPVVMALKSDAVKEMLKTNKVTKKSFHYKWMEPVFGKGLVTSEGGHWKSHRKLLNPCFHSDVLRNYFETYNYMSQELVKVLLKETEKDFTYIIKYLSLFSLDVLCETVLGTRIRVLEKRKTEISDAIKGCERNVMERMITPWFWPDSIFRITKTGKDLKKHLKNLQGILKNILEEKRKRYLSGENTVHNGKHKGVIDVLLEKQFDTQEMSEQDVTDEVFTFMTAGHDTVAMALMWALYVIGHHPDVQAKIHEEVDHVFQKDKERVVTEEDIKNLKYLDCVLKESHRLYPAVPIIGRCAIEDFKVYDSTVPKGTTCAVMVYFLHRDKNVFPDPEKFDPDRFSAENRVKIPEFAYIPFSAGPRNCIGFKFAENEMRTVMSYIFRNFSVESMNKVLPVSGISLHASEPIRVKFRSRIIQKN